MNRERRKLIDTARNTLANAMDLVEQARELVEQARDEEQDYLDNIPDNLQSSDRYMTAEEAVNNLESALDWFDEIDFDDVDNYLSDAAM